MQYCKLVDSQKEPLLKQLVRNSHIGLKKKRQLTVARTQHPTVFFQKQEDTRKKGTRQKIKQDVLLLG